MNSTYTPEFRLLSLCIERSSREEQFAAAGRVAREAIDWADLVSLAKRHRVVPQVFRLLQGIAEDGVPRAARKLFGAEFDALMKRNLVLTAELARIARRFSEAGISLLGLKGPVLAIDLYGGLERREYRDLDVVVRPKDVIAAIGMMKELGYEGPILDLLAQTNRQQQRLIRSFKDVSVFRATGGLHALVELHWRLSNNPGIFSVPAGRMWSDTLSLGPAGAKVHRLPAPESIVYLAYHGSRHRWKRLSWLCDFSRAVAACRHPIDELRATARDLGVERCLDVAAVMLRQMTSVDGPPQAFELVPRESRMLHGLVRSAEQALLADDMYFENKLLPDVRWNCQWPDRLLTNVASSILHIFKPSRENLLEGGGVSPYLKRCKRLAEEGRGILADRNVA